MTEYAVCYDRANLQYHLIAKNTNDDHWDIKFSTALLIDAKALCEAFEAKERERQNNDR